MPLPLYPVPQPYTTNIARFSVPICTPPNEGTCTVPLSIDFGNMSAADFCVSVNLQQNVNHPISQICAMFVDNTSNSHAVKIIMPDTQQVLTIGAGKSGYYPVATKGLQFIVWNQGDTVAPDDVTNILVFNFAIPGFEWSPKRSPDMLSMTTTIAMNTGGSYTFPLPDHTDIIITGIRFAAEYSAVSPSAGQTNIFQLIHNGDPAVQIETVNATWFAASSGPASGVQPLFNREDMRYRIPVGDQLQLTADFTGGVTAYFGAMRCTVFYELA